MRSIKEIIKKDSQGNRMVFHLLYSVVVISLIALTAFLIPFYYFMPTTETENRVDDYSEGGEYDDEDQGSDDGEDLVVFGDFGSALEESSFEMLDLDVVDQVGRGLWLFLDEERVRNSFEELGELRSQ